MTGFEYLEKLSVPDEDGIETVTLSEAQTALYLHEYNILKVVLESGIDIVERLTALERKVKFIKINE